MMRQFLPLLVVACLPLLARAQQSPAGSAGQKPTSGAELPKSPIGADLPSPEEFVNAIAPALVDSGLEYYFLVAGTDSCRFLKYNYDEWQKYHLAEPLPFQVLNELAEKVYLSHGPYFWKQVRLQKAICVTRHQADSIVAAQKDFVYSFSLPQFTDDGQFAVIDLNLVCGPRCGKGVTCIFRLLAGGEWKLVGEDTDWEYR